MDATFLTARKVTLTQVLQNLDSVILQLSLNPRASYSIDTGQSKETVTAASLPMLYSMQQKIIEEINDICDELNGGGDPQYMRPAF